MSRLASLLILVTACGGPAAHTEPTPSCDGERADLLAATETRDGCLSTGSEVDDDERAYLVVRQALDVHSASLAAGGEATEEGVMALADGFWAYLDQVASHFTDHAPLDRAEDAAEALVRDRTGDGARTAAARAIEALDAIFGLVSGGEASEPCAEEVAILHEATEALERCEGTAAAAPSDDEGH